MKREYVMIEGDPAFGRFHNAMKSLLTITRMEIADRISAHRAQSLKNPNRRGPKPKAKGVKP